MYSATIIVDIASHLPRNIAIFRKINEKRTPDLCRIATIIQKTVDLEGGVKPNTFCVKQGIEDELDEKKRLYYGLPDLMDIIAEQELQNLDDEFGMCCVMYLPRLGYMVAVNETPKLIENNRQIPNFQYTFSNDGVSHYKTAKTMELDRQLGDMHYVIRDRENVILEGLQTLILGLSQTIYDAIACCAELDCLLAFASVAREYCYTRPKIMSEPSLKIIKSRHPLQEHCVSSFVENDIIAGGNNPTKITILTGPNASGKSVYLKQIALLVFMAHIGSYVPAQSAEIGLVDGIFTQIRLIESVTNPLSAFMLDLNQIALGIRISTSNSLTIIDEFGQGTDESDGLALLASIINYWIRNQFLTPLTFVSTHFHSLKNLLERSNIVKYKTMEVYIHGGEEAFLYNIVDGVADGSYAHKIAEKAGIPKEMIQRGLEMSEILSDPKSIPEPILTSESYKEKMKECDDICAALLDFHPETGDLTGLYRVCKIDLPAITPLPETTNQEESSSPKPRNTRQTEEDLESSSLP